MAISCICHYRPAHKLVTAHLECRAPSQKEPTLNVLSLSLSLSLFLIVSFSSLPVVGAAIEITFLFLYFDLSSSCTRILPMLALSWSAVVRPGLVRWERRSDRVPQVRRFARNACHRVVRMAMGSVRRSLSSLINVVSLLIYRRVAAQPTDDTTLLETTLGIPISGLWARFINYDHGRSINLPKLDTLSSNTLWKSNDREIDRWRPLDIFR